MGRRMMLTALEGIPSVKPGDDLAVLVIEACKRSDLVLEDGDLVVLAQKIVSKTEGRSVDLRDVVPSPRARELAEVAQKDPRIVELILRESTSVLRCRPGVIIVEHRSGLVMANAGIDASTSTERTATVSCCCRRTRTAAPRHPHDSPSLFEALPGPSG
jgi:coenzyme F420-0:L-glutamate ligase/coenzyme F420-1:gamma-L-glutamate ligase